MTTVSGNTITIPGGMISGSGILTAVTNSTLSQVVNIQDSKGTQLNFQGSGQRNQIGSANLSQLDVADNWTITLQFSQAGSSALSPSVLKTGGPYSIGSSNFFIVVAENGDDADFNDCVCQISWKSS